MGVLLRFLKKYHSEKEVIRIFIIEDDQLLAMALKGEIQKTFEKFPAWVSTFENGEACIPDQKDLPDILIVDDNLNNKYQTVMNGVQIIDQFKTLSQKTEFIMLIGNENSDTSVYARHLGAHDYIVKHEDNMFRKLNMALYQCIRLKEMKEEVIFQKKINLICMVGTIILIAISIAVYLLNR